MVKVDCKIDKKVEIIEAVYFYWCELKESVFVGPFVEIQSDVLVKSATRIQSHSFICSGVTIGKNCFIGHGVVFTNDKFSNNQVNYDAEIEKTIISDNVIVGSNSTILPVKICSDVIIGAGSVVTKDIDTPGKYAGNPAEKI